MVSRVRGTRVCRTRRYAHIPRTLQYQRKIFGAEWMEVLEPCWLGIAYRHDLPGHPDLPRMRDKRLICLTQGTVKMEFRERNTTIKGLNEPNAVCVKATFHLRSNLVGSVADSMACPTIQLRHLLPIREPN